MGPIHVHVLSKTKEIVFSSDKSRCNRTILFLLNILLNNAPIKQKKSFDYTDLSLEKTISLFLLRHRFCFKSGRESAPIINTNMGNFLFVPSSGMGLNKPSSFKIYI